MSHSITSARRRFFKKIIAGIGGAVTFAAVNPLSASGRRMQPPETPVDALRQGYRETGHIRKYYQKARF